jgi:hypothetical protein
MDIWSGHRGREVSQYILRLHVIKKYIRLVTKEYTFIFLDTDEYNDIYSSVLYSSVPRASLSASSSSFGGENTFYLVPGILMFPVLYCRTEGQLLAHAHMGK